MKRGVVLKGLALIILSIIFGAFGAHYLETILTPEQINSFKTGVEYQMYGGLILIVLGINFNSFNSSISFPIHLFFVGVILFSFSIYCLSIFNKSGIVYYLWPITPLGGLMMIIALVLVFVTICKPQLQRD